MTIVPPPAGGVAIPAIINPPPLGTSGAGAGVDNLLLETGDNLLLESGDVLLLE